MNKTNRWNLMMFFMPDGVETGSAEDLTGGASAEGTETSQEGVEPKPSAAPTDPNAELRKSMTELAGTVKSLATPKEQPRQLTQDQIDEHWAIYNPTKSKADFFDKFFRLAPDMDPAEKQRVLPELQAIWKDMQQGLVRQAVVGARNLFMDEIAKLRKEYDERLTPMNEYVGQQRAEQTRGRFYSQFPALDTKLDDGRRQFERVINATARTLADKEFANEGEYFKALAEGAAEAIRDVNPAFDLGTKPTTKQTAGTSPRLPRTSVGGTGGTSRGGTQEAIKHMDGDDANSLDFMAKGSVS